MGQYPHTPEPIHVRKIEEICVRIFNVLSMIIMNKIMKICKKGQFSKEHASL